MRKTTTAHFWTKDTRIIASIDIDEDSGYIDARIYNECIEELDEYELEKYIVEVSEAEDMMEVLAIRGAILSLTRGHSVDFDIAEYTISIKLVD